MTEEHLRYMRGILDAWFQNGRHPLPCELPDKLPKNAFMCLYQQMRSSTPYVRERLGLVDPVAWDFFVQAVQDRHLQEVPQGLPGSIGSRPKRNLSRDEGHAKRMKQ